MTLMQLLACAGMITGAFLVLGLKPMEFTDGLFGFLMQKPRTLKEEINEATKPEETGSAFAGKSGQLRRSWP